MLQEVASWPRNPAIEGWQIFHEEFSTAAMVLPSSLGASVRCSGGSDNTSSVLLEELGVMSAYLADSGKSIEEYDYSIREVRGELQKLCKAGARIIILGCDAQVELPPNIANVTGAG